LNKGCDDNDDDDDDDDGDHHDDDDDDLIFVSQVERISNQRAHKGY